jgi:hypothetical protein
LEKETRETVYSERVKRSTSNKIKKDNQKENNENGVSVVCLTGLVWVGGCAGAAKLFFFVHASQITGIFTSLFSESSYAFLLIVGPTMKDR